MGCSEVEKGERLDGVLRTPWQLKVTDVKQGFDFSHTPKIKRQIWFDLPRTA